MADPTSFEITVDGGNALSADATVSAAIVPVSINTGLVAGGAIYENSQTISADYTMATGKNGLSAGPVSVASGVTVTIPSGSEWVIV